jgi:hypothetical protein
MTQGIVYLLHGRKLGVRLVVSLRSLRSHYSGPVAIISTDPESSSICSRIADDKRLNAIHITCSPRPLAKRHWGYVLKTYVHQLSPFDESLFLDCDTVIRGDLGPLFSFSSPEQIVVTRCCNRATSRGIIAKRIKRWKELFPELVESALRYGHGVNTGIFAFTRETLVMDRWRQVAVAGADHFIPDEIAMQLLLPHYPHQMLDQRFNCSPKYGNAYGDDVRVVHFHGRKHVGSHGQLWKDQYQQAVFENLAGLCEWTPASDRTLRAYLREERRQASQRLSREFPDHHAPDGTYSESD